VRRFIQQLSLAAIMDDQSTPNADPGKVKRNNQFYFRARRAHCPSLIDLTSQEK
jgi:hypothetical protein